MGRLSASLVLGILLHTLLMVGSVDAAMPSHHAPVNHGAARDCSLAVDHADHCFRVGDVSRPSVTPLPVLGTLPLPPGDLLGESGGCPAIVPPHHPPDVIRALLQVFRI